MARDDLDFLLDRPQDPLQELMPQLPPAKSDEEALNDTIKEIRSNYTPDVYNPATGSFSKGTEPSGGLIPRDYEAMALDLLSNRRKTAEKDQKMAVKQEEDKRLAALKALQDRNQRFTAAGLAPPVPLSKPEEVPSSPEPEEAIPTPKMPAISTRAPVSTPPSLAAATQQVKTSASDLYGPGLGDKDIVAAQEANKKAQLMATLLSSGDLIGQGLSRGNYKGTPDIGENILKMGKQGVEDIMARREGKSKELDAQRKVFELASDKERNDPNSAVSQLSQDIVDRMGKSLGINVQTKGMSVASLEKVFGPIERYAALIETKHISAENNKEKNKVKEEKEASDLARKLGDTLDPSKAGNRTAMGKAAAVSASADRIQALVSSVPTVDKLNPQQMVELARSLDTLLTGGSGATVSITKELVPQSIASKAAGIVQWITNNPTGTNQKAFVDRMMDTVNREREVANQQISRYQTAKLPAFSRLQKLDPTTYDNILSAQNLGANAAKSESTKYTASEEAGIAAVMKGNGISREEAVKALKEAGKIK